MITNEETMHHDLVCTELVFRSDFESMSPRRVAFHRMNSPYYSGEKWAVRNGSFCLSISGEWIYELSPSMRDEEFYQKYRFDSLESAIEAVKRLGHK